MKVSFVIQKLNGLTGGAERILIETALAMRARGFEVSILTFELGAGSPGYDTSDLPVINLFPFSGTMSSSKRGEAEKRGDSTSSSVESVYKRLPHSFPLGEIKWQFAHGLFIRSLKRYIRRERPTILIPFMPHAITACAYAAKGTATAVLASIHNVPERDFGASDRWDQNPVYRRRSIAALSELDRLLVLLPEFRDWFPTELQGRLRVMPNPVRRLGPPVGDASAREQIVLGVGRLTKIKRFDLLVRAWAELGAARAGWRLRILGDGPERAGLERLIKELALADDVALAGTRADMAHEYDRTALLCHPAEFEGFGLVVGEALAHGVPAVAYRDCPGANTLIEDGVNGVLVDPGDAPVRALAVALEKLMKDGTARARLAQRAPEITERYASARIYDMWEEIIREAVAARTARL